MSKRCWCGNDHFEDYSEQYYVCKCCKTLVVKNDFSSEIYHITNEENDLYGRTYWEDKMLKMTGLESLSEVIDYYLKDRCIYWIKELLRYKLPGSTVKEVGCGLGQFPYLMRQMSYKQKAYELSNDIRTYVANTLDVDITTQDICDSTEKVDCIIAMDLIEHILEPCKFIHGLSELLNQDGILCLQTPCYDNHLDYSEMLKVKPRFQGLMTEKEHIFLYSRESITKLLNNEGFMYIDFVPAYFGDDYDMFLFASKQPFRYYSDEEIENAIYGLQNGRIIKALLNLFDENVQKKEEIRAINKDRELRLKDINILTQRLHSVEREAKNRLDIIKQFEPLQKEMENRLRVIEELSEKLRISEEDRQARLDIINRLTKQLEESEADRAARLEVINRLNEELNKR